jgi:hypothetical protein
MNITGSFTFIKTLEMTILCFLQADRWFVTLLGGAAVIGAFLIKDVVRESANEARKALASAKTDFRTAAILHAMGSRIRETAQTQMIISRGLFNLPESKTRENPKLGEDLLRIQIIGARWRLSDLTGWLHLLGELRKKPLPSLASEEPGIKMIRTKICQHEVTLRETEGRVAALQACGEPVDWLEIAKSVRAIEDSLDSEDGLRVQTAQFARAFLSEFRLKVTRSDRRYRVVTRVSHWIYVLGFAIATAAQLAGVRGIGSG